MKNNLSFNDVFIAFMTIVVIISGSLTFAFFYEYLPFIFPSTLLGEDVSRFVSGVFGTVILEAGSLVWLFTYLRLCENRYQRSIAFQTSIISFSGSLATTFVQLIFMGNGLFELDQNARNIIGFIALFAIAFVLVYNFASIWRYKKNSNESIEEIEDARREDSLKSVVQARQKKLDRLVEKNVDKLLQQEAPELAMKIAQSHISAKLETETLNRTSAELPEEIEPIHISHNTGKNGHTDEHGRNELPVSDGVRRCKYCKTPLPVVWNGKPVPGTVKFCRDKPCQTDYEKMLRAKTRELSAQKDAEAGY